MTVQQETLPFVAGSHLWLYQRLPPAVENCFLCQGARLDRSHLSIPNICWDNAEYVMSPTVGCLSQSIHLKCSWCQLAYKTCSGFSIHSEPYNDNHYG